MSNALVFFMFFALAVALLGAGLAQAAPDPATIPDEAYVQATENGALTLNGERVRFWGFIGGVASAAPKDAADVPGETAEARQQWIADERRKIDRMVERIDELGFNLVRTWEGRYSQPNTHVFGHDYEPGDGSQADMIAYYYHQLDQRGIKIWMSSTNRMGYITPGDVDILDDPETADDWQSAMRELQAITGRDQFIIRGGSGRIEGLVRMWDPRWEAVVIQRHRMLADFPNHYKDGLRLGDDPQIAVWELTNEEFAFRGLFNGRWRELPAFFRNELLAKWHGFLQEKYGSDEQLQQAWGFLLPGETLTGGSVMLAPLASPITAEAALNDTNPAIIESLKVHDSEYTRDDFTRQRGADVVEFFTQLVIEHKQRLETALETMGRSCQLSPTVYDSGNSYRIQSAYMHQFADAVSTCSYTTGMAWDPDHRRFPFHSSLDASPRTSRKHPWFEQSTAANMPHFVYETQINNKTKYRAEYPMQVAALASINDWDIVCWHSYSGRPDDLLGENPFDLKLATGGDHFTFRGDEVQLSAMKAAGEIFTRQLLNPAPEPTTFIFGRRSLYDPASMDYAGSFGPNGDRFVPTAYHYGAQVKIDPDREDDEIVGPSYDPAVFEPHPVTPNDQITFDWQQAHLKLDSPAAASYTGFFGQHRGEAVRFRNNSVRFSDIQFNNPAGIAYPVTEEEGYVAVSLVSTDGRPLAEAQTALLSAVSTSFNTGYQLDLPEQIGPETLQPFQGAAMASSGDRPVLVVRVGLVVEAPEIDGMHYVMRDFHMRPIAEGTVEGGRLELPDNQPVFVVELTRE